jgi:hypothetical protein
MTAMRVMALGLCVTLLAGCASAHYVTLLPGKDARDCAVTVPTADLHIGVALSGGGSRAALFGSAGLEALAGVRMPDGSSILEHITHLSSVSGGSIAATHYALRKPGKGVKVLNPDGTMTAEYQNFFKQYRDDLGQDFETALIWRQLLSFRWINSALAARTLAEILAEKLYGDARLQTVAARESAGDSPGLIVNTTLYNNGRRLAMTSLAPEAFDYDFFADLERELKEQGSKLTPFAWMRERWKVIRPLTPIDIGADPCTFGMSGVVAASASFPPLVGPITMRVGKQESYWHAGDGGLYENQGLETLLLLYLKQLQIKRAKRVLILGFDSSYPFSVGERKLLRRSLPFSLLTFDFSRIPSIMEERASTYSSLFFGTLQLQGVVPDPQILTVMVLRHTDAKWAADLSDLPPACQTEAERKTFEDADDVVERIAEIPTRLVITSECDRQLLETAARKVVAAHRDRILEFVARR